jgi:hypothetical protein
VLLAGKGKAAPSESDPSLNALSDHPPLPSCVSRLTTEALLREPEAGKSVKSMILGNWISMTLSSWIIPSEPELTRRFTIRSYGVTTIFPSCWFDSR